MFKNLSTFIKLKPALAVGFLFCVSSLIFGIWVAAIPSIKQRLGFSDGSLGLSLLLSPLGALTGVALSTKVFKKIAVGKWMLVGYCMICLIMVMEINAMNRLMLWCSLYFFGLVSFLNGVSANATVNILEKKYDRNMMSTCHGLYSLGGGVSTGLAILFFSAGIQSGLQIIVVAFIIILILLNNRHHLLLHKDIIHSGSGLKFPSPTILGISFICMVVFMAEGCVADWSALYFKESLHVPKALVSIGYTGFAVAMTIGRFNGDQLIKKIGGKKIVIAGSILASMGFVLVVTATVLPVAVAGYICIGFGCSCIVPVLFSASANIPGVSKVEGFAMVTTGGLLGFLTGPSLIGLISEQVNLSAGLSLLILFTLCAALVAWRNRFLVDNKKMETAMPYDEQLY
ncbi:MFS transporter [Ferruginibacter lapsinanis]|uniref:MFS transporter n=1 Tax=Ferruginibacter lapsinanis TaxID=563172 RepID=UPI001E5C9376|nr:MFS transporter [Ferruginibacter lapsinanis]UEG48832.1 MFS transporter [Ferruginibacter lapsinanis]